MPHGREHVPSPVKQRILWSSPLKGMERPVRSFKSFIQTTPPTPEAGVEKPLPPIPRDFFPSNTGDGGESSNHTPAVDQASNHSSWQAPTEWEWDSASPLAAFQAASPFASRDYCPLLPEPSPGPFDLEFRSIPWSSSSVNMQEALLDTIDEGIDLRPEPPPRNPSRLSHVRTPSDNSMPGSPVSEQSEHGNMSRDVPEESWVRPSPRQSMKAIHHVPGSGKAAAKRSKALATLGFSTSSLDLDSTTRADSPHSDESAHYYSTRLVQSSATDDTVESSLSDQLDYVSFSQDYHDVLLDQYHRALAQGVHKPERNEFQTSMNLHTEIDLFPHPLNVRKPESDCLMQVSGIDEVPFSRPGLFNRKPHTLASLQEIMREGRQPTDEVRERSASASRVLQRSDVCYGNCDRPYVRASSVQTYTKGLISQMKRIKATDGASISRPSSASTNSKSVSNPQTLPARQASPILRLPGGFALVRDLPAAKEADAPRHERIPPSPTHDRPTQHPNRPSPHGIQDRSSPVLPTETGSKRPHDFTRSPPSSRPSSSTSSPPPSPLANEIFRSRSPLQAERDASPRHGILDTARDLRDAWKRHKKEMKHNELKQSIRVLGIAEPGAVAAKHGRGRGKVE
ncbi:hypothetical protein ACN47E_003128 [Coniothyrium glycines]